VLPWAAIYRLVAYTILCLSLQITVNGMLEWDGKRDGDRNFSCTAPNPGPNESKWRRYQVTIFCNDSGVAPPSAVLAFMILGFYIVHETYYYIFYISVKFYLTQASQAFKLDAAKLFGSGFLADRAAARVLNLCSYCRTIVFARAASGILGPRILSARLRPW
jgi:hypothetical protein